MLLYWISCQVLILFQSSLPQQLQPLERVLVSVSSMMPTEVVYHQSMICLQATGQCIKWRLLENFSWFVVRDYQLSGDTAHTRCSLLEELGGWNFCECYYSSSLWFKIIYMFFWWWLWIRIHQMCLWYKSASHPKIDLSSRARILQSDAQEFLHWHVLFTNIGLG